MESKYKHCRIFLTILHGLYPAQLVLVLLSRQKVCTCYPHRFSFLAFFTVITSCCVSFSSSSTSPGVPFCCKEIPQSHLKIPKETSKMDTVSPVSRHSQIMQSIHVRHRLPHFLHFEQRSCEFKSPTIPTYFNLKKRATRLQ